MAQLEVPIISTIIGEGGSGGALAISVGDQVLMLQFSVYSVISPEGCASILWKTAERRVRGGRGAGHHGPPPEGAGRDRQDRQRTRRRRAPRHAKDGRAAQACAGNDALRQVVDLKPKELLQRRYERLRAYGRFTDTARPTASSVPSRAHWP
jgi:acetyl-CoA carboxylase carboxyl transferase subunit alpha